MVGRGWECIYYGWVSYELSEEEGILMIPLLYGNIILKYYIPLNQGFQCKITEVLIYLFEYIALIWKKYGGL